MCGSKVESHFYSTNQTQPYRIKADLNQTLGLFSVSYDAQCLLWVCCGHPRADPKQYAPQADPEWTLKADPDFRSRPLNPGDKKNDGSAPHYSV